MIFNHDRSYRKPRQSQILLRRYTASAHNRVKLICESHVYILYDMYLLSTSVNLNFSNITSLFDKDQSLAYTMEGFVYVQKRARPPIVPPSGIKPFFASLTKVNNVQQMIRR